MVDEDAEQRRLQENALFTAWEQGYKAGMNDIANPDMPRHMNPYQWHGKDVK